MTEGSSISNHCAGFTNAAGGFYLSNQKTPFPPIANRTSLVRNSLANLIDGSSNSSNGETLLAATNSAKNVCRSSIDCIIYMDDDEPDDYHLRSNKSSKANQSALPTTNKRDKTTQINECQCFTSRRLSEAEHIKRQKIQSPVVLGKFVSKNSQQNEAVRKHLAQNSNLRCNYGSIPNGRV